MKTSKSTHSITRRAAIDSELVQRLHDALDRIAIDHACRVIVLTGAGRGFCAGLDLKGYGLAPHTEDLGHVRQQLGVQKHIQSLVPHFRRTPQPIIAAVNGAAAGGGFAMVLGSDIRIAAESAKFNAAFVRIGISACDIGTSWLLPRLVGAARAQELMLTGRIIGAQEALRIGLVTDVVPDGTLMDAVFAKADEIQRNAPFGIELTKEAMWTALEVHAQAAMDIENRQQLVTSMAMDANEARQAFMEKRPPKFTNQ
ncbi:MAG: enoyl-CoA hydratase/isomerase family protein [Gammaproteobacteria bacterium]